MADILGRKNPGNEMRQDVHPQLSSCDGNVEIEITGKALGRKGFVRDMLCRYGDVIQAAISEPRIVF